MPGTPKHPSLVHSPARLKLARSPHPANPPAMTAKNQPMGSNPGHVFNRPTATFAATFASDIEREIALQHYGRGDLAQAEAFCRQLTQRHPRDGFGWKVLGATLRRQNRTPEALEPMQLAAKLMPGDWEAFNNLGVTHDALGNPEHAQACFEHALKLKPDFLDALRNIAENLRRQDKLDQALDAYQRIGQLDPGNGYARHMADTLSGHHSDRAPAHYVTKVFDDYADSFEEHLISSLAYQVPQQLVDRLTQVWPAPTQGWDVLDLGCGTGLVGKAIATHARSLTGVDLSSRMIDKSREAGCYHRLVCEDLSPWLQQEATASVDVIVAADVFIYIGRLDELMAEVHRLLRPGGCLAFSIETHDGGDGRAHRLERTGRYSQSLSYLDRLAQTHGFKSEVSEPSTIRQEAGNAVPGQLCVWRR